MSEKRYFKVEYDEEWYLFDSTTISEQLVKEQAEYGYGVFANSLSPSEIVDLLNEQDEKINEQQATICKLEQRDYYNQSERYKILGRAIELASDYIHRNDLEYYDFCGLITEFEKELLDNGK